MAQNFTYTDSDEMNIIAGVKRPGDKENPLSELLADQKFNGKLHAVAGEKALALQADIWSLPTLRRKNTAIRQPIAISKTSA